jgi:hypothetical protein
VCVCVWGGGGGDRYGVKQKGLFIGEFAVGASGPGAAWLVKNVASTACTDSVVRV